MLDAALRDGTAERRCVFELFARRLPGGRRYGVVAGTGRAARADRGASASATTSCAGCATSEVVALPTRSTGSRTTASRGDDHAGYREGELYFPGSPVLVVEGTFAEAVVLETLVAQRAELRLRGRDRRRADGVRGGRAGRWPRWARAARGERSAVAAARAAYIAGFARDLEPRGRPHAGACRRWARPRTRSRCCTTPRRRRSARRSTRMGAGTTLLVDTYDMPTAVATARVGWRAPSSAPCASTPATCPCVVRRGARRSSTSSARRARGSP